MSRRFFICSVGEYNSDYEEDNLHRCETCSGHFMHRDTKHKGLFHEVSTGDIVFLKFRRKLVAYGEVKGCFDDDTIPELGTWTHRILVKRWVWNKPDDHTVGVSRYGVGEHTIGGDQFATVKEISEYLALDKAREIDDTDPLYLKMQNTTMIDEYISLLESNRNIILHGAPGTGKTFLAKEIARAMDAEVEFVQFHPSYDYTDFVEGLRPVKESTSTGAIGFELRDGIFKSFCERALKNLVDSRKPSDDLSFERRIEQGYNTLVSRINDDTLDALPQRSGKLMRLSVNTKGNIEGFAVNGTHSHTIPLHTIIKLAQHYKTPEALKQVANIDLEFNAVTGSHCYTSGCWAVLNAIYGKTMPLLKSEDGLEPVKERKFVFIIDEINRAEMSKVLGELFFSIDPGYRGAEGAVRTQYANLADDDSLFDEMAIAQSPSRSGRGWFFIPENVYIIGTMNDIDRSVDRMDFAMRRRFAFREVSAAESEAIIAGLDSSGMLELRMRSLNRAIIAPETGLSSAYQIGGAYFKKFELYADSSANPYDALWSLHIEGLLKEYLRGMDADGSRLAVSRRLMTTPLKLDTTDNNCGCLIVPEDALGRLRPFSGVELRACQR